MFLLVVPEERPLNGCVCVCVRACIRACVRACMRACVHACVVQVIKSLQDPLEAGNNLTGISDSVRE